MKLAALFGPDRVLRLRAGGKDAVLAELSRLAAAQLGVAPAAISGPLSARERLGSTGVGAGVALPHARLPGLAAPVGFFARLDRPVDWTAIDGKPVDLICLLLSPPDAADAHLMALAAATRRLRQPAIVQALRAAADARKMFHVLIDAENGA